MATEVLHPQDCLVNRFAAFPRRRTLYSHHQHDYKSQPSKHIRDKNSPVRFEQKRRQTDCSDRISRRSSSEDLQSSRHHHHHDNSSKQPVTRQVTILKRGESLLDLKPKVDPVTISHIDLTRSGLPEPSRPETQIWLKDQKSLSSKLTGSPLLSFTPDIYAGSAFAVSPAPESLPLPSFPMKKQIMLDVAVDASATRDLRRLLRLEC